MYSSRIRPTYSFVKRETSDKEKSTPLPIIFKTPYSHSVHESKSTERPIEAVSKDIADNVTTNRKKRIFNNRVRLASFFAKSSKLAEPSQVSHISLKQ